MRKILIKKETIENLYFTQKLSLNQISKILKISNCTVESRLKEFGFKLRNKWEAKKLIDQSGKNNSSYIDGRCSKKYYCECGNEICYKNFRYGQGKCLCCSSQINSYFNLGKNKTEEQKKQLSLSFGGNGIPYSQNEYPKEFYYIRESIRRRDKYKCQNCGMTEKEHLIVWGKRLTIHHIDYNKKNCKNNNLISVCFLCNIQANSKRTYWQEFYTKIISQAVS